MSARTDSVLLDANAALRYLIEDIPEQAQRAEQAIHAGAEITIEVLMECVYVLEGYYGEPRSSIAESLGILLDEVACRRHAVAATALGYYSGSNLDFVDCILAAEADVAKREVLTFDKKLASLIGRVGAMEGDAWSLSQEVYADGDEGKNHADD